MAEAEAVSDATEAALDTLASEREADARETEAADCWDANEAEAEATEAAETELRLAWAADD